MGTITERYDEFADRYGTWWGPVLAPTAIRLLERHPLGPADGPAPAVLDIGTGTGVLALEAARRWPTARVVGVDASSGMLGIAKRQADTALAPAQRSRLEFVTGDAGSLPFPDRTFDLVVTSFVLQLVSDRARVLGEALRVLRSGGRLASVTWLVGRADEFAPDVAFDKALDELDLGDDEDDPEEARSGDFVSARAAADQLRRVGFRGVRAVEERLIHAHDPATYLDFLEQYAERELFEDLDPAPRERLRQRTAARLARLPADAFVWSVPVVEASGRRP